MADAPCRSAAPARKSCRHCSRACRRRPTPPSRTVRASASAARGIAIEAVESELEGDVDLRGFLGISKEVRKGYREIRVRMRVKSVGSATVLRELAQYSPVFDVVSTSVPVKLAVETY